MSTKLISYSVRSDQINLLLGFAGPIFVLPTCMDVKKF